MSRRKIHRTDQTATATIPARIDPATIARYLVDVEIRAKGKLLYRTPDLDAVGGP